MSYVDVQIQVVVFQQNYYFPDNNYYDNWYSTPQCILIWQLTSTHKKRSMLYIDSWNNIQINSLSIKILNEPTMVFDRDKKEDRLFCLTRYFSSNGFWWSFLLAIYCHQIFANVLENETSNISKWISLDISHWSIHDKFNMGIFFGSLCYLLFGNNLYLLKVSD